MNWVIGIQILVLAVDPIVVHELVKASLSYGLGTVREPFLDNQSPMKREPLWKSMSPTHTHTHTFGYTGVVKRNSLTLPVLSLSQGDTT